MSFISGFVELFKGKREEAPTLPQPNLDELKQHEANLNQMISEGGKDYRNPADANTLREVRNKIAAIENKQTISTPPETTPTQAEITQIPVETSQTPVEEPSAA